MAGYSKLCFLAHREHQKLEERKMIEDVNDCVNKDNIGDTLYHNAC